MPKAVLAVALLAVMAGAWYWALQPPVPPVARDRPPSDARSSGAVAPLVRLHLLDVPTRTPAAPGPAGRDPFRTAAATASDDARPRPGRPGAAMPAAEVSSSAAPTWPRIELIGVAEARDSGGVVRTAIVSGPRGVQHARAGDVLEEVYRLERIGPDAIDVRLIPEDRLVRLLLRP